MSYRIFILFYKRYYHQKTNLNWVSHKSSAGNCLTNHNRPLKLHNYHTAIEVFKDCLD